MRISDWSSDVCSSDLLDFHATVLRFAFFGRIAGDGLSLAKAPGGNPRRLNPIHAEVIGHGLGAAFAQRLVVHVGAGAVGMAVNVDIGDRIILRSEEPTSELQALQRTSYDGF